jgi:hypothetical protein
MISTALTLLEPEYRQGRGRDFGRLREKVDFAASAPKGESDFEGLALSLKRYPDTKPELFGSLLVSCPGNTRHRFEA